MPWRDPGARRARLPHEHDRPPIHAFSSTRTATRPRPPPSATVAPGGLLGGRVAFLALTAFATAPSALYGLYEQREHLSPITLTIVYAV
jgi:hypothetical protein